MKLISLNTFGGGMASDIYNGNTDEFSTTRNFDILSYPDRLNPYPGMASATATGSKMGNLITTKNATGSGAVYGYGVDVAGSNLTSPALWKNGGTWSQVTTKLSGQTLGNYEVFIEYDYGQTRTIVVSGTSGSLGLASFDLTDTVSPTASTTTINPLSYSTICQGFIHPKNNTLYIGYDNKITQNFQGSWTNDVLEVPKKYTITSLTQYGNYLAIACTYYTLGVVPSSANDTSVVFLWDMTSTSYQEVIVWGDNTLKQINYLDGVLIGVSAIVSQQQSSLLIKGYSGGQPQVIKHIKIARQDASTTPSITIYPNVNLIHKNRMIFSADLVSGGTAPSWKGLWEIGKNDMGRWTLTLGQFASTDGSDVSVLAATYFLDYLYCVHTAVGTLTQDAGGSTFSTIYSTTSYYESLVNPGMTGRLYAHDKVYNKTLHGVGLHYLPLPSGASVTLKYRVDGGAWISIFTETTAGSVITERKYQTDGTALGTGRNFEFRIESSGFGQVVRLSYKYEILSTLLTI